MYNQNFTKDELLTLITVSEYNRDIAIDKQIVSHWTDIIDKLKSQKDRLTTY